MDIRQAADAARASKGASPSEPQAATLSRCLIGADNQIVIDADLLKAGNAAHIALINGYLGLTGATYPKPFYGIATLTKAIVATGSVVFTGLPLDGETVTINDGAHTASVFEFDDGTAATGTLTFTGVPADTGTVSLGDGTTSKVFEFDTGVAGVASTGGLITFSGVAADGNTITLTTHAGVATIYEANNVGGVTGGSTAFLTGTTNLHSATGFAAAVNAGSDFTAVDNADGTVTLARVATGASNQTITKVGANIAATNNFSGGVTQVAVGSAITGGRVGVGTATTPGGAALTTAQVCTNLINAINAVSGPAFLFTASQGAGTTVTLTANTKGTAGNAFTMAKSATNFSVSAATFANGAAAGSGAVTGSNIAVAISTTGNLTATNLHTAINAAANLDITSTNSPAGTCALANDLAGTAGNVTVTETATNVTATGMAGGVDMASATLLADSAVGTGHTVVISTFTAKVDGATAWNDAASVAIKDSGSATFATIAKAALTGNAFVHPSSASVTLGTSWMSATGGADGKGIVIVPSANENTGSDLIVKVAGLIL